jgi:putative peptidoglycan lipid II flippase
MRWGFKVRNLIASFGWLGFSWPSRRRNDDDGNAPMSVDAADSSPTAVEDQPRLFSERLPGERARGPSSRRVAAILMTGALVSKILGFVREILMAKVLGASMAADGFRGAITAVLLPLVFLQNESISAIMIPMQRESHENGDAPTQLAALTIALTLAAAALMLAIEVIGPWWVDAIVGGFVPETQALTLQFVRIMALAMPASVMSNCLAAGEIASGRSRVTNIRASLLNVSVLIGIGLVVLTGWLNALAWSFTIAFNALGVIALWLLWRAGRLSLVGVMPATVLAAGREFVRRLRPLLALPTAEQGHVWIERALASRLVTGSVASLEYARTLTDSAVVLISQPMGIAILSSHSQTTERARIEAIARPVLALMLPASVFLFMFAPDVIGLVFHRGAFNERAVVLTSQALRGISLGLWAATLGWILLRILNRTYRNTAVAIILVASYAVNIAVNLGTAGIQESSGAGTLIIGLGEAARSFTLLAGVALALKWGGRLLVLLSVGLIPVAIFAAIGWIIDETVSGSYQRLFVGGSAWAACTALAASLLIPTELRAALRQIRVGLLRVRKA